ncbi:MAG: sigma-54-dependent Fis family transcriptional regulator [Bacteroidota bacterium]
MNNLKLESLIELASILAKQNDFEEVLRLITQRVSSLLNAETALIMMINPRTRETIKTIYKEGEGNSEGPYQFIHTYFSGWVIDKKSGFVSENIKVDSRFNQPLFKDVQLNSVMCVPFSVEGTVIGTLLLLSKISEVTFTEDDYLFLNKFADIVSPYLRDVNNIQPYFAAPFPKEILAKKYEAHGLLGKSNRFIRLLQTIESAVRCDVRVLLEGQSGTGKEVIARSIHHNSLRNHNKFVAIDCGAIPANLIESELFGHTKGAYTGANFSRKGLLEEANGGTLFMDEIANLPLEMQAKLLRVLQESEIRPVGSNETRKVDVRIITASSKSLKKLVEKQKFREDLFYRLYVYPISVPSLNERSEDIPLLANHFLKKYSSEQQKQVEVFHEEVLDFLKNHLWSGNIRELQNFVERLVTLVPSENKVIDASLLPVEFQEEWKKVEAISPKYNLDDSLENNLAAYENKLIRKVLIECGWNQSKAARQLKISERTIRYKMSKLGINKNDE